MRIHYGDEELVMQFVASLIPRIGEEGFGENSRAIGVVNDAGELVGGVVYNGYDKGAGLIEMSAGATDKRWLTGPVLHTIFSYPFDGLKCQMVVLRIDPRNKVLVRILERYGFSMVTISRLLGRENAGILATLTEEAWRANGFHKEHQHG
jgi:RimJ/RimL family protein N-acetyltransferase